MNLAKANLGKSLELIVIRSQQDGQGKVLCLHQVHQEARRTRDGLQAIRGCSDFHGCVEGPGRAIVFDAKACDEPHGFPLSKLKPHQREYLIRMGQAGAIAGVLVEAKRWNGGRYLWLAWEYLQGEQCTARWEWTCWTDLGDTLHAVRFRDVPGVGEAKDEQQQAPMGRKG